MVHACDPSKWPTGVRARHVNKQSRVRAWVWIRRCPSETDGRVASDQGPDGRQAKERTDPSLNFARRA